MKTAIRGLVLIAAGGLLTACSVSVGAESKHEERTYDVGGQISTVKVSTELGPVEVVGADTGTVRVSERLSYNRKGKRPKAEHQVEGGVLALRHSCPGGFVIGANSCDVAYRVTVPRGTAVEVTTETGDIRLAGLSATVKAESEVGGILAEDLRGARVTATSAAGDVRLSGTPDVVTAKTESGSVELTLPDQPYAVDAATETGDRNINVVQDPRSARRVTVRTETGTITVARA